MSKRLITILLAFVFSSISYASGGGGGGGGGGAMPSAPKLTPLEQAINSYRQGLKLRDKAWKYESKAAEATAEKNKAKYIKKAQKQFVKAQKKFSRAIKKEPRLYQAHSSLGYAYRRLGDYEKSLAAYDEALRLNANYSEAIEYRAEAYLALGRYSETQEAYMILFVEDRPRADELMAAMLAWQSNTEVKNEGQKAFTTWIEERHQLSLQTASLSGQKAISWQDP